ncbi:MAG: cation-translocating P-type ATPase [Actinomycetota bacterium]
MATEAQTNPAATGLTRAEVAERVERGQVNDVSTTPSRSIWSIVRENTLTWFNLLLGSLAVIIIAAGSLRDAMFGLVIIANAAIGIIQELRAKRTLDRLAVLSAPTARALRDGDVLEMGVDRVVLDDVLDLQAGDQIVVDGTVLASEGLEIDESLLTGEADPVVKAGGDEILSGSFVAAGSGRYRATRVGHDAYAAQLASQARRFTLVRSELRSGIDRILKVIGIALVPAAALLVWSQLNAHESTEEAIAGAVAGTVAMVPEGLVLLTSVAFAVGVVRLARHRVLVQELAAIEILARVDVLCIDKTGTLTEGKLDVEHLEIVGDDADVREALAALAAADPNPNATLRAIGETFPDAPDGWWIRAVAPFSSARKWSGATFEEHGTWIIGAPDVLLPSIATTNAPEIAGRCESAAVEGSRVVLAARAEDPLDGTELPGDLQPSAIVVLGDRVRSDAAQTLAYFAAQDVAVKVISGDHPATVAAVAGKLDAPGADDPVDARTLPEDPGALAEVLDERSIFGRVTPQQKRAMVGALQSRGHVVAMTGDGVNDVLALKDADIGVAMGSGAAATRAVAQLVLLDSTFDSLPPVVAEGRRVLGNIERTANLYLTKSTYAWLLAVGIGLFALPFPFLPRHLTLVGALTIGIPSFFLALAPNTERARPGFLRRVLRFSLPAGAVTAVATFLAYALVSDQPGISLEEAQTTATMVLAWVGLLIVGIVAKPLTPARLMLIWGMAAAFLAVLLIPVTQEFFALELPPAVDWLAAFGIAAIVWSFARLFIPRRAGPTQDRD